MRAAEKFFAEVIAEHGIEEGDIVRIPMTQCELARRRQIAPSTVGSYLSSMGPRVVQRTPQIVLNVSAARYATEPTADESDLLVAFQALAAAQARVIELLAQSAGSASGPRGLARGFRGVSREEVQESKEEDLLSYLGPRAGIREPRADPADAALWNETELDALLTPLHRAAELAGAKAMNNRPQLLAALRPFSLTQIEIAVAELVAAVNSRTNTVRSPFGMLVTRARKGTMPTVRSLEHDKPSTSSSTSNEPDIPVEVRQAVRELSPCDVDALDAFIDSEIGRCSYRAPAMTDALRLEYFKHWLITGTPVGDHEDTPRTSPAQPSDNPSTPGGHQ